MRSCSVKRFLCQVDSISLQFYQRLLLNLLTLLRFANSWKSIDWKIQLLPKRRREKAIIYHTQLSEDCVIKAWGACSKDGFFSWVSISVLDSSISGRNEDKWWFHSFMTNSLICLFILIKLTELFNCCQTFLSQLYKDGLISCKPLLTWPQLNFVHVMETNYEN